MPTINTTNTPANTSAKEATRAYNEKAKARKEAEENAISYKEELKKAREDKAKAEADKKAMIKREPVDGQGSTIAKKSARQMLDLLANFATVPNMPTNLVGGNNA